MTTWICARCRTRFDHKVLRCPHDGKRVVEDLSGVTIAGRYELRELVGIGGMDGTVWKAWQTSTHRAVAVKLLPAGDDAANMRFDRGARIASNLNHPHITIVHDNGRTEDGKLFLVMELLEGQSLHRMLKDGAGLPLEVALHVADQTLRALEHAHKQRVAHRDLKPGNLFLVQKNDDPHFVKVLDFGIAKYVADDADGADLRHEVTEERQICGTPHYMAPEQIMMGQVDGRTDLYALGVVLFRMITGRLPFESKEHHELFRMHLNQEPPRFSQVRPDLDVPGAVEDAVRTALAKLPEQRFADAAEMRRALRQVRHGMGIFSGDDDSLSLAAVSWPNAASIDFKPSPKPAAPPKRARALPVVAVALLALGGALWALWPSPEAPPPAPPAPPPPTAPAAPASVPLKLASAPEGAVVFVDGARAGLTPVQLDLAPGRHTLRFEREGHLAATLDVDVPAQAPPEGLERTVTLEPEPPAAPPSAPAPATVARPALAAPRPAAPVNAPAAPPPRPAAPASQPVTLLDGAPTPPPAPRPAAAAKPAAIHLLDDPDGAPAKAAPAPAPRPAPAGAKIDLLE